MNYLFLINGYYTKKKNYIVQRVRDDLHGYLFSVPGVDNGSLIKYAKELLKTEDVEGAVHTTYFFLHSFYDDPDFLTCYLRASSEDRLELAEYILQNREARNGNCCLSKKYESGGNFSHAMLYDETRVFLLTTLFLLSKRSEPESLIRMFVNNFHDVIALIRKDPIITFLKDNKNIFIPIFEEILEKEDKDPDLLDVLDQYGSPEVATIDTPDTYIDETTEVGKQKIKSIFSTLKKQARKQSGFTCSLEVVNNCKPIYFTSRATGKTYLEVHHLIPQEFRNDFAHSIEVLANYTTLCPRCHRQLHLAVDRERKPLLNALYHDRIERLRIVKLEVSIEEIYNYYKIKH